MTAPAEVTLGPSALPHLRALVAACRAGKRDDYDGAAVDWAEQVITDLMPVVPMPRDLSGLGVHLQEMHGIIVHKLGDYKAEHDSQHRRGPDGADPEAAQPHTHPREEDQ